MWNWLDPGTVVSAFARIIPQYRNARLVFVTQMPADLSEPSSAAAKQALDLSRELGLYDDKVLFCGTVPFNDRQNLLCEADIGLCYNAEHLEARFSFRTRLLDYIWAGLPIITGRGDILGQLVDAEGLGHTVPPADVEGLAAAMSALLKEDDTAWHPAAGLRASPGAAHVGECRGAPAGFLSETSTCGRSGNRGL